MRIAPVDPSLIPQIWPDVKKYIESALSAGDSFPDWSNLYNIEHIRLYLFTGEWQLLVACDSSNVIHGAMTIKYCNYPLHRVAFICTVGGVNIITKDHFLQLKNILKFNGATMIQAYGRKSIQRMLRAFSCEPRLTLMESLL